MTSPPPQNERALLFTLAGIQFTHIVDFMVMMPLGPHFTRLFGITDAQFGVLVSAYTLAAGASGVAASAFIDRFERKSVLLWLYAGFALATLACGLAPTYMMLMAARVMAGLFGGVIGSLVHTMVADAVPFERRGQAMGIVMASFSLATVVGVPGSLALAQALGWHASFIAIALVSFAIGAIGLRTLPRLTGHLHGSRGASPWQAVSAVLREPNHWRAFGLSMLTMGSSFIVIPFLTIYYTANVGLSTSQIPLLYLAGGAATIFTARWFGVLADRWGKARAFRIIAALTVAPVLMTTHMGPAPLLAVLAVSTAFFVFVSGRMVPGMALISSAAVPSLRGAFMSLNNALQSAAMGLASMLGGALISRDASGAVQGFERCGWVTVLLTLVAVWWVSRLQVAPAGPGITPPRPSAAGSPSPGSS